MSSTAKGAQPPRNILLCDTTWRIGPVQTFCEELAATPIQCLEKAVETIPALIVIRFGRLPIKERNALVELSAALKRNSHTRKCPILALLRSKHRKLLEDLVRAGVEFVRYSGDIRLDSIQMEDIVEGLGPNDRLARQLNNICPNLHYSGIDSRSEMTVCGAYLDRMVLGGDRLHEICETEEHLHCEYYLNPRVKP